MASLAQKRVIQQNVRKVNRIIDKTLSKKIFGTVNKDINPVIYRNLFKTGGIITVPNFLNTDFAEKYYKFLNDEMKEDWWYSSAFYGDKKVILPVIEENMEEIKNSKINANNKFVEDGFSYFFYRTYNNHFEDCDCLECYFRTLSQSPEFIKLMSDLTGLQLEKNNELFISKYSEGCFLNVHNDTGNGKIAFVLNLTRDWKPQYGGNFHILTQDRKTIRKVIEPKFNSLTIFRVPDNTGIPHYVSHVVPGLKCNRYAVSGWFS
jgi:SM-20-related protein